MSNNHVIYYTYPENFKEDVSIYDAIKEGNKLRVFPSDLDIGWSDLVKGKELASVEDTGDGLCVKIDDNEIEMNYHGLTTLKILIDAIERSSTDGVIQTKRLIEDD